MKKILSIVAVLALVFALAVPALAAPSATAAPVLANGGTVELSGGTATLNVAAAASSDTPDTAAVGSGNSVLAVYEVSLKYSDGSDASADYFAAYSELKIDFGSNLTSAVIKVLHKTGGSWVSESFSGSIVTVTSLSPFALIVKADSSSGNGNQPGKRSPQTGYNTALWTISAVAMVVCAGYCFSARKKVSE